MWASGANTLSSIIAPEGISRRCRKPSSPVPRYVLIGCEFRIRQTPDPVHLPRFNYTHTTAKRQRDGLLRAINPVLNCHICLCKCYVLLGHLKVCVSKNRH